MRRPRFGHRLGAGHAPPLQKPSGIVGATNHGANVLQDSKTHPGKTMGNSGNGLYENIILTNLYHVSNYIINNPGNGIEKSLK